MRPPVVSSLAPLLIALAAGGCRLVEAAAKTPGAMTRAVIPGSDEPEPPDTAEQQAELMRLADRITLGIDRAAGEFAELAGTEEARLQAATWRVHEMRLALAFASRPDTIPALLDTVLSLRMAVVTLEKDLIPNRYGEPGRPLLEVNRRLEEQGWRLATNLLGEKRATLARSVIDEWAEGLENVTLLQLESPPSIDEVIRSRGTSLTDELVGLFDFDPFTGLEPTTREIAMTRLFAERVLFFGKHMPELTRAELELAALQMRAQPEPRQLLADVERISTAAERFGKVADDLPAIVAAERGAALNQVFENLDRQREGLVRDLQTAEPEVSGLLESSRLTLEATERASSQLTDLVTSVDTLLDRFEPDEAAAPPTEPPRPFDITEYGDAVTRLGETMREMTLLLGELGNRLPEVGELVDVTAVRGEESLDHAFARALQLGLALITAAAVATLVVRRVGLRAS